MSTPNPEDIAIHFNFINENLLQLVVLKKVDPTANITPMVPILIQVWRKIFGNWVKMSEFEPPQEN